MFTCLRWAVLLGCLGLIAACDTAPGPAALDQRPPVLSDFSVTPRTVVLEALPPSQVDGDSVLVPLELRVTAQDPDGAIEEVGFIVQSPFSALAPVAMGTLRLEGDQYVATETIRLHRGAVGAYPIVIYAVDESQQLGGEVRGTLSYFATGNPPVIESVEVPDAVTRPAPGEPPVAFQYVAVVSDPDGLSNIATVEVEIEDVGTLLLCDDGGQGICTPGFGSGSGDETAGDGRFTLTLQVDSTNQPATLTLRFKAIDRAGLESDVVERTFTIQ